MQALLRYMFSGLISALIYALASLTWHHIAGLPLAFAGAMGYLTSMPFAYLLHRKFSFSSSQSVRVELPKFVAQSVASILFSGLLPSALVATGTDIHVALLLTSIAVPIINYIVLSYWVFKNK